MRRFLLALAVAASLMLVSACGSGPGDPTSGATTPLEKVSAAASSAADGVAVTGSAGSGYTVNFKIKDNLSSGMTRDGIAADVFGMLKAIAKYGPAGNYSLNFRGTFPMQDKYGSPITPDPVVFRAAFTSGTAHRINYDSINTASFGTIGDLSDGPVYLHPAFE